MKVSIAAADGRTFSGYLARPESGSGPGLVLAQEIFGVNAAMREAADLFTEEGYTVLVPDLFWRLEPGVELGYDAAGMERALALYARFDVAAALDDLTAAVAWLRAEPACAGGVGLVGYCLGGTLAGLAATRGFADVAVGYYPVGLGEHRAALSRVAKPLVLHFGGRDEHVPSSEVDQIRAATRGNRAVTLFEYPDAGHAFANPRRDTYHKAAANLAHSRTIAALRKAIGPIFDLEAIWAAHLACEFETRDTDATMATMTSAPYVNHIPTLVGGVGQKDLREFYARHFIPKTPPDFRMVTISRTVGADHIVDEFVGCFTHTTEFDFILPGVAPTGRYVEIPTIVVVNFRGGKVHHEHIYWDQASVLAQVGLLDATRLPVSGVEQARKALDESAIPSNRMLRGE
jgi:carboxymethylenebutenolidase